MAGKITRKLVSKLVFLVLLNSGLVLAQTRSSDPEEQQDEGVINQRFRDETSSEITGRGRSLQDSVTQNPRNTVGFSLGLFGLYDSAAAAENQKPTKRSVEGMIQPMVFANFGRRKAILHLDYSMERRIFTASDFDSTFHTGNIGFSYTPNRSLIIELTDEIRSAPSNLLSLSGGFRPGLPGGTPLGPGISAYSFERLLMNNATGRLAYRFTRNNTISFYGNSQIFRYKTDKTQDMNPYNLGASLARALTRDVDASVEFLACNYDTISGSRRVRVKRLSGGLNYRFTRHWSIRGSGGVEWVEIQNSRFRPYYLEAGLGRVSRKSIFALSYRRGAQYQLGTPLLTANHTAAASLDQRISKKSSILLSGYSIDQNRSAKASSRQRSSPALDSNIRCCHSCSRA